MEGKGRLEGSAGWRRKQRESEKERWSKTEEKIPDGEERKINMEVRERKREIYGRGLEEHKDEGKKIEVENKGIREG